MLAIREEEITTRTFRRKHSRALQMAIWKIHEKNQSIQREKIDE